MNTINKGLSWNNFGNTGDLTNRGISALAVDDESIWIATAFTTMQDGESLSSGGGLYYSSDRGQTWTFVAQPIDVGTVDTLDYEGGNNKILALAITTVVNNVTFDIALTKNTIWIASFAGMLRKSTNRGLTWDRVILPPDNLNSISPNDSLDFDLAPTSGRVGLRGNLNHRVFSLFASDDSTIWVGTAGGINKSTDGGISWQKYSHQNQLNPISGNFVVALKEQRWASKRVLWAATINAEAADEIRGVSFSADGGQNWKTALLGEFSHNISFQDSIVYVATDGGLFRSSDEGATWSRSGTIYDKQNLHRFSSSAVFAVSAMGDTVWVGGPEGITYTLDAPLQPFGSEWKVFRTYQTLAEPSATYSYPSPFSPDDEVVRIHYTVSRSSAQSITIRIFDFAMQPVRTLIQNAQRAGPREYDEIWDGNDNSGKRVANGVYFYRVEVDDAEPIWGKIFAIQ
ncbi:MAG: hypothetical protein HYY49_03115 [Ignavibacteriales bacterium]|nr:hypothetical protein [Ignavibacteriales bacterium]